MPTIEVQLPPESKLPQSLNRLDFCDAYETHLIQSGLSVNEVYLAVFGVAPRWVRLLMFIRGHIINLLGLKPHIHSQSHDFTIGNRVASFKVIATHPNELIVGDDDKHLNYRISTLKTSRNGNTYITISTAVEIHNRLGQMYMFCVKPFHKCIAPFMLEAASRLNRL